MMYLLLKRLHETGRHITTLQFASVSVIVLVMVLVAAYLYDKRSK